MSATLSILSAQNIECDDPNVLNGKEPFKICYTVHTVAPSKCSLLMPFIPLEGHLVSLKELEAATTPRRHQFAHAPQHTRNGCEPACLLSEWICSGLCSEFYSGNWWADSLTNSLAKSIISPSVGNVSAQVARLLPFPAFGAASVLLVHSRRCITRQLGCVSRCPWHESPLSERQHCIPQ